MENNEFCKPNRRLKGSKNEESIIDLRQLTKKRILDCEHYMVEGKIGDKTEKTQHRRFQGTIQINPNQGGTPISLPNFPISINKS